MTKEEQELTDLDTPDSREDAADVARVIYTIKV